MLDFPLENKKSIIIVLMSIAYLHVSLAAAIESNVKPTHNIKLDFNFSARSNLCMLITFGWNIFRVIKQQDIKFSLSFC